MPLVWMEVGHGPGHIVLDGNLLPFPEKWAQPPIFGACLLWPNGWMDQDATWYRDRPQPRPHCVRWRPSSPTKGAQFSPIFIPCLLWPNGWMDQDATWCEVGVGPGHIVLDGDPALPQKGAQPSQFLAHVYCGQAVAHLGYC